MGLGREEEPRGARDRAVLPPSPPGLIQSLGAFLVYFTVYAQEGFAPSFLLNLREAWERNYVNDLEDSYGQQWVRMGSVTALPRGFDSLGSLNDTRKAKAFKVNRACGPLGDTGLAQRSLLRDK